ncbi:membrane protein [Streptomyces phage Issmi]|uniref:Membrane protein n=1 Tax=Streptomyces phage Issmi TaxID=2725628 RepID=A0A6M3T094_9CAUD|nr:membrane protein [Streptomyces phage Issmi]QJD50702.1 membrane protein [Streptomyces phage Issmi]
MRRDNTPVIVTFVVAVFVLGLLSGAVITDHAWKASTRQTQEDTTP